MPNLIAFPFRLSPSGAVATNPDGTDECYAGELAMMCLTRPGERVLVPDYGLNDPTFDAIDTNNLQLQVSLFGPPVVITDVRSQFTSDTTQDVVVDFDIASVEGSNIEATTEVF